MSTKRTDEEVRDSIQRRQDSVGPPRPPPRPRLDGDTRASILCDWSNGVPGKEIEERYGVSPSYARTLAARHGYAPRQIQKKPPRERAYKLGPSRRTESKPEIRDADRSPFVSARVDVARARELQRKGVGLTAIATLLGARYADVYAVLAAPELPV